MKPRIVKIIDILGEANVVAVGSMKRFLKGKMYNRCRRGHLLLFSAFYGLYFKRFLEDVSIVNDVVWARLANLAAKYERYADDTLARI